MTNVFKNFGMAIVAILMIVGFSAFKVAENTVKNQNFEYFEFENTQHNNIEYLKESNWTHTNSPVDCGGIGKVCVLRIEESLLSGIGTPEEQLIEYFESLGDASSFVDNEDNMLYQRY